MEAWEIINERIESVLKEAGENKNEYEITHEPNSKGDIWLKIKKKDTLKSYLLRILQDYYWDISNNECILIIIEDGVKALVKRVRDI